MREKLEAQIKALLDRHRKQEHSRRAAVILSACMVFCVIAALMNPAAAMTNPGSITIAADDSSASLTVTASAADADSTFMIKTALTNAALSDSIAFDENNQAVLTDKNGTQITLTRVTAADGSAEYSFTLAASAESVFTLPFTSVDSSTAGTVAAQSAWGTDLASAEDALAKAEDTVSLSLAAVSEDIEASASAANSAAVSAVSAADSLLTASGNSTGTDFSNYIDSFTVNGTLLSSTSSVTVTDGNEVSVEIKYTIGQNVVTSDQRTIYYQLKGLFPKTAETGTVVDNGKSVGTYSISTDGMITITFNDNFAYDAKSFSGTIKYAGTASLSGSTTTKTVDFDGKGGKVIIQPVSDLTVAKEGILSKDKKSANYKITVSSASGTDEETVNLNDYFQENNVKATATDFVIKKYTADGVGTIVKGYTPTISSGSISIAALPALAAGESYQIKYSMGLTASTTGDGQASIGNSAQANTKKSNGSSSWIGLEISKQMIGKSGYYDQATQKINWTITVNSDNRDLSGYEVLDTLGGRTLASQITITDSSTGKTLTTISAFPYTFPSTDSDWNGFGKTDTYTITYQTDAPSEESTVSNTSELKKDGKDYTSTGTVSVKPQKGTVAKSLAGSTEYSDSTGALCQWNGTITLPAAGLAENGQLTYTDTIKDAYSATVSDAGSDSHYAIASELAKEIKNSLSPSSGISYELECRDSNGKTVSNTDSTVKIKSFTLKFTATSALAAQSTITFKYSTHASYAGMKDGEPWTYENDAKAYDTDVSAKFVKDSPCEKLSGIGQNGSYSYAAGNRTLTYDETAGKLYYRILIRTDKDTSGAITVVDTLPAGTTLDSSSVSTQFYVNEYYLHSEIYGKDYNLSTTNKPTVTTGKDTDGNNIFTVVIPDGYNEDCETDYRVLAITYTLELSSSYWADLKNGNKEYNNSVYWKAGTEQNGSNQKTTVTREVKNLQKTGEQVKDSNGNLTDVVKYKVIINPAGKDLNASSNILTMTDTLTTSSGTGELVPSAIKLYRYDGTTTTGYGEEISSILYSYQYEQTTNTLVFKIPDETPCVLVYEYYIDRGTNTGNINVSNSATLKGSSVDSSSTNVVVENSSSSATAHKTDIIIYKVDSQNYSTRLSNAKFTLDALVSNSWTHVTTGAVKGSDGKYYYTTDNGLIDLYDASTSTLPLSTNTLYRLTETNAPANYTEAAPVYFVWLAADANKDSVYSTINSQLSQLSDKSKLAETSILFLPNGGGSIYVADDYSAVKVTKQWLDASGNKLSDSSLPESISVQLYQQIRKVNGYTVTLTPDSSNYFTITPSSQIVKKNSQLTINFTGIYSNKEFSVYEGDTKIGSFAFSNNAASLTLTVNSDMNLTVKYNDISYDKISANFVYSVADTELLSDKTAYGDAVKLTKNIDWTYTWEKLPLADSHGNEYYYTVEETGVSGYKTTYINNGVHTGEITVINTATGYQLPSTGGGGIAPFWILGLLLMAVPLRLLMRRHMHEGGEG